MVRMHLLVLLLVTFACTSLLHAGDYGAYEGTVQAEWLNDGRKMKLLASFAYIDPQQRRWEAPKDWVVDGASIPQVAWTLMGGPFEGKYRNASVIHDVGCDRKDQPWESVHETFYWGMLASGVERWRAKVMYAAVYHFGPRWERVVVVRNLEATQTPVARQRALETSGAAPGSNAEVIDIRRRSSGLFDLSRRADFSVRVNPPTRRLSESDFENLKATIEGNEEISLREIQTYRP